MLVAAECLCGCWVPIDTHVVQERERVEAERQEEQRMRKERLVKEKEQQEAQNRERALRYVEVVKKPIHSSFYTLLLSCREKQERERTAKERAARLEKERQVQEVLDALTDHSSYAAVKAQRERERVVREKEAVKVRDATVGDGGCRHDTVLVVPYNRMRPYLYAVPFQYIECTLQKVEHCRR